MTNVPSAEGDPSSPLWQIGRDFGDTERRTGKPFQGLAGSRLNARNGEAGIQRGDCFIHNVVAEQPPGNDWARHKPGAIEAGTEALQALIAEHQPKLIVTLGNEAFRACMGEDPRERGSLPGIQDARGYLWDSPLGVRVLSAIHPAAAEREWVPWMVLLGVDLRKAKRELDVGCPPLDERSVTIVTEPWELQELRNAIGTQSRGWIALDTENDSELQISCLGVAVTKDIAYTIPAEEAWQLAAIQEICENDIPKVLQNHMHDVYLARKHGFDIVNVVADSQFQWHVLQPELAGQKTDAKKKRSRRTRKSLVFLSSIFCRTPWYKDYNFHSGSDEQYILCGRDCCDTLECAEKMQDQLEGI